MKMKPLPEYPQKILVRSTNWIGDAVMTTPAVRTIRENFPEAEITLLAMPWVSGIFQASPCVDRIMHYDKLGRHKGLKGKLRLTVELSREKYDVAILLQNAFEAALITFLARIPVRAGYTTDGRGLLLTHGVKKHPSIGQKHQVHYYQEMLEGIGLHAGPSNLELVIDGTTKDKVQESLQRKISSLGVEHPSVIGLNPGASYGPAKRWPASKFAKLAADVLQKTQSLILIFGTVADQEAGREIQVACGSPERVIDLTGKTDLTEAMAYIELCTVFITNDSGLMHVASALHTPTVALFGSTDHVATGPYSDKATLIRHDLACSPCMQTHCPQKHFQCMEGIGVEEVFSAVQDQLMQRA